MKKIIFTLVLCLAIGRGHLATWPDRVLEWIRYIQINSNAD